MYQKFRSGQKLKLNDDNLLSQIGLRRWRLQKSGPLVFPSKLQVEGKKETTRLILMLLGPRSETISGLSLILVISLFKRVFFPGTPISPSLRKPTFPHFHTIIDCKTVGTLAYSSMREQSNKRSGARLKTESDTEDIV